jgi:hypothetical protein
MSHKKYIEELAERFPNSKRISVEYYGSGDSFDSFNDLTFTRRDGTPYDYDEVSWNNRSELMNEMEMNGLLWDALERSGADFNNEGSRGYVHINLDTTTLEVENYWIVQSEEEGGGIEPYTPEDTEE